MRHGSAGSLADVVGSLQERGLLDLVFRNPDALNEEVAAAMQPPLAAVEAEESRRRGLLARSAAAARRWSSPPTASRPGC